MFVIQYIPNLLFLQAGKIVGPVANSFYELMTAPTTKVLLYYMPDIVMIRPDIRQFNLLYLTTKIPLNKYTKAQWTFGWTYRH